MIKLNGELIKPTIFSDKTSQVWQVEPKFLDQIAYRIEWEFENEGELMHLAMLVDILKVYNEETPRYLNMPFLPYGRQDKEVTNESTFALRTFAKLLNTLEFKAVSSFDTHGAITKDLINNFEDTKPTSIINNILKKYSYDLLCFPDAGAYIRYGNEFPERKLIKGRKVRNQLTGYIDHYSINGDVRDRNILVVDDLCDGGMTFKLLAKSLKDLGANKIDMYVSHGIFSRGKTELYEAGINKIFTKDSV